MPYEKLKTESYNLLGGINAKASPYVNGPMEFRDLSNLNFVTPGALTKRPGTTLAIGATIQGRITGGIEFERLSGASYMVVTANTNAYTAQGSNFNAFKTGLQNNALFDFVTFVDRLFACNGNDFFRFDGANTANYNLPAGMSGWGVTTISGGSLAVGTSGVYVFSYGYLNDRGYYGPAAPGITIALGGNNSVLLYGLTTPPGFGISAIALYRTIPDGVDLTGTTLAVGSSVLDIGFPLGTQLEPPYSYFTLIPRFMEIFNNQLFMAGFSTALSTVVWSDIGEPEGIDPTFSAEFRTNDGDRVTAMKSYNGSLIVTKERSTHRVVGSDPTNFVLQEISDQYGCLSNRAIIVFEQRCWFLDSKGIVEYDGANIKIISNKMEPVFQRMNLAAARDNAVAIHYRDYNEAWFAIPVDGATCNNLIIVYDYASGAFTHYDGVNLSSVWIAKGDQSKKTVWFGGYTGNIFSFGPTFFGDYSRAITCLIDTRWLAASGQTTEHQYRRFYLDLDPVLGISQAISLNFRTNYGSAIQYTASMLQNPFQSRIDFGLSAKSIQAEILHVSPELPFKVNGFAFESRYQRNV